MKQHNIKKFIIVITIFCLPVMSFASGFRIPESSIAGMSLSNAIVANTDLPGALIYNPALMSAHDERRTVTVGMLDIKLDTHVDPDLGTAADSQGDDSVLIPNFYYMSRVSPDWAWGLGVDVPFGLETEWPAGTFGAFSSYSVPTLEPEKSKLELINITPNVAYQINAKNSVAVGVNYYMVRELIFNSQAIEINADGNDYGYTLAYQYHDRGTWSFGATYRSAVKLNLSGSITVGGTSANASADVELPAMFQLGVRNRINDKVALEFNVERTNWSSFDVIEIEHKHSSVTTNPIVSTNNWKDVTAYRLGLTYQMDSQLQLRFGLSIDKTPQPDDRFSARIPDADRKLYSAGAAFKFRDDLELEGGLMLVKFDDRTINQPANSFLNNLLSGDTEANGTDAYNGKYESSALIVGIGLTASFDH